jgi:hypothetical protein
VDPQKINAILHRNKIQEHYNIDVGGDLVIAGPRVPMTRYTEFVCVDSEEEGDVANFLVQKASVNEEEGVLAPREINVHSTGPGILRVNFVAKDSFTGEAIPGVEPVGITVTAS